MTCPPRREEETALSGALPHSRSSSKPMRGRKTPARKRGRHWWKSAIGKGGCVFEEEGHSRVPLHSWCLLVPLGGRAKVQHRVAPVTPAMLELNATTDHSLSTVHKECLRSCRTCPHSVPAHSHFGAVHLLCVCD